MKKMFFKSLAVCFFAVLFSQTFVFAGSYVRARLTNNQPQEAEVYGKEIAPFSRFSMKPVTPSNKKQPVILENITLQVENFDQISSAVNKFVLILDKSKGVDRVNENRVVAQGSYGGGDYVTLYSLHGSNIFSFKSLVKATVSLVMNESLDTFTGGDLSLLIRSFYAIWINGSYATIKGYLPMTSVTKAMSNDPGSGIANEMETPYGTLKYEVPEVSSESVSFRKIFIYGKKKGLKLLVRVEGEESREFRCRHNSYITSCDFGRNGIIVPKGSTITITASEQGIFYQGFETLDVFCEGEQSGRRIFVSPLFSNGKG